MNMYKYTELEKKNVVPKIVVYCASYIGLSVVLEYMYLKYFYLIELSKFYCRKHYILTFSSIDTYVNKLNLQKSWKCCSIKCIYIYASFVYMLLIVTGQIKVTCQKKTI